MSVREMGLRWKENVITKKEESSSCFCNPDNKAVMIGTVETELRYSHQIGGERFYQTRIRTIRNSETEDLIPVTISEFILGNEMLQLSMEGKLVVVAGEVRSYKKFLYLLVSDIDFYDNEQEATEVNLIYLDGCIWKQPVFRSASSRRNIADLMIEVRNYQKSNCVPCIAWGRTAQWASKLSVGTRVQFYGRFQSRRRFKRYSTDLDKGKDIDVYEISVMAMKEVRNL